MKFTDREIEKILSEDIQIPDKVNDRICETYDMLRADAGKHQKKGKRRRYSVMAAAAAVICCLAIPGGVYAAVNSDFFDGLFGNATKKSTPAITKEVDNQKGGTTSVTIPAHEYVSVDPKEAEKLVGSGSMTEPVEKQLGEHRLRIENLIYDKNSAFMYFTLERKGGVTMLVANEDTNAAKGAYFAEDELYRFSIETTEDGWCGSNIYVDTEKSTEDKLCCYAYMLWADEDGLAEGEFPVLSVDKYPCPPADLKEEDYDKIETETTILTKEAPVPVQKVDMGDNGYFEYSPVSIAVDLAKGTGLSREDAADPANLWHMELKYKDGSNYVISDAKEHIENSGYALGVGTSYRTAYNRIVNVDEISEIVINDKTFPVN